MARQSSSVSPVAKQKIAAAKAASADRAADAKRENFARVVEAFTDEISSCKAAFDQWRDAAGKADDALYAALGRVYQAYETVDKNAEAFDAFVKDHDALKLDHRKTRMHYMIDLSDLDGSRSTRSQYAACLLSALGSKIPFKVAEFVGFLESEGGVAQAASNFRKRNAERTKTRGRRSNYEIGQMRASQYDAKPASQFSREPDQPGFFVTLGEFQHGETPKLFPIALNDEKAVRAFFEALAKTAD